MLLQGWGGGDFIMVTAPHFRNWNEMKMIHYILSFCKILQPQPRIPVYMRLC